MANKQKISAKKAIFTSLKILAILIFILIILTASFFAVILFRKNTVPSFELDVPASQQVEFHTSLQKSFLYDRFYWHISPYADGTKELSRPEPLTVTWNTTLPATGYVAAFSEYADMHDPIFYPIDENSSAKVYNLKVGTTYYCQIYFGGLPFGSEQKTITTAPQAPRNMYVDGVTNVRDLGGWAIEGGRVKQGLIYRCGRLNENGTEVVTPKITGKGIETMVYEMNIKSEMDLRKVSDNEVGSLTTKSVLGDSVNYYQCPMGYNGNMLINNAEMVRHIFSDILSKKENYPLIFHCSIGTDRTGMIAFLINGLLGVDINDLYRDYLFSNFGDIGGSRDIMGITFNYVTTLENTKGKDLQEKIQNYLLKIGVTQEEINAIREILSERA